MAAMTTFDTHTSPRYQGVSTDEFAGREILHVCSDDGGREIVGAQRVERSARREQRREIIGCGGHLGFVHRGAVPRSWAQTVRQRGNPLR